MEFNLAEAIGPFAEAVGTAQTTFTTKKDISPQPLPVIRANKLYKGAKIHILARGEYSSLTGAVLTLGLWFGTRTGTITGDLALAGAFTTGTTPAAWPWRMEWDGLCTATGASGSVNGDGYIQFGSSLTAFNAETPVPVTQALRTVTIDTTIERAIGVSGTWGASSASNSVTVNSMRLIIMNGI